MTVPRRTDLRYPGGRRAVWGALAYVVSYLAFVPLALVRGEWLLTNTTLEIAGGDVSLHRLLPPEEIATTDLAGILFFNAQFVPVSIPIELIDLETGTPTGPVASLANPLLQTGGVYLLAFAIPPVLYTITGVLATHDMNTTTPSRRAKKATLQFTGCLPLAVLSVFLFSISAPGGSGGPDILWGIVVTGWVYPTAFGALGGWLAVNASGSIPASDPRERNVGRK